MVICCEMFFFNLLLVGEIPEMRNDVEPLCNARWADGGDGFLWWMLLAGD